MAGRKFQDSLSNLESALAKLESALQIEPDRELVMEGTIQRFEIVFELMWKTLKRALKFEGLDPKSPRDTLKESFSIGWLHDEDVWLDMLDRRNTTSHQYLDDELVENNYQDIHVKFPHIQTLVLLLRQRYPESPVQE